MKAKTLRLPIKKKWFDMIASGTKKVEYRKVNKYWDARIAKGYFCVNGGAIVDQKVGKVLFVNGYGQGRPAMLFWIDFISIDEGDPRLGAEPGEKYFCIHLGNRIS